MEITLQPFELRTLLADAAELGASRALSQTGAQKPYLSMAEACRQYGRRIVNRWIKEGLISKGTKDGVSTKIRIDRLQLESAAKVSNRTSWFTHNDRKAS
jgi:hypothetical protein